MSSTETFSIYLLKEPVASPAEAFKDEPGEMRQHEIAAGETSGTLFVRPGKESPPDWVSFLEEASSPPLEDTTKSLSAVLLLEASGRLFAIAFGHGRTMLDPDAYERDFGLMTALNGVDPEKLRGAEARTFNDAALHTLRQLSRLSTIASLELNTERDLVVSLSGQLEDSGIGKRVDGRDAARFTASVEPAELRGKCSELLSLSEATSYRAHFPFFDVIKAVRDPQRIASLNTRAFNALGKHELTGFSLFPPEMVGEEIVGFRIGPPIRGALGFVDDPSTEQLKVLLRGPTSPAEVERLLSRATLHAVDDTGTSVKQWTYFECLHWEVWDSGAMFVLDRGRWYRVEGDLAKEVEAFADDVGSSGREWPAAESTEEEGDYNARVAAAGADLALLDKNLVRLKGQTGIEPCDLFSSGREFIHVKRRKGGSAPLSHLFGQAMVSGECFVAIPEFREKLEGLLESAQAGFGKYAPEDLTGQDFKVVLAMIAGTARTSGARNLPFFSKVMLRLAVRRLESMGYEVFVDEIPVQAKVPTGLPVKPARARPKRSRKAAGKAVVAAPKSKDAASQGAK